MLSLYRPGDGLLHRMPAGPKLSLLVMLVLAVSLLPTEPWSAVMAACTCLLVYMFAGLRDGMLGLRVLGTQLWALKWVVALMLVGQVIFLGPLPAVLNTARVVAALLLAALLALTTRVTALLDAVERGLAPLAALRIDPARVALMLTITLSTLPVMGRFAHDVREAQRARGARPGVRTFAVPYLVMALKHANELGDALAARGVR
ncbi:energy-coupling factor transporter transmembrane protein EcfT [Microbacterium protaetiae]|uniref:Energy-coupling factor transporter transmembrane protein EcfT n=1 Tax=Microbacterium protaetiae TaxID=2509458 RepID=A0A4P6ECP9_9MICO|nr:energy-coupling factor transporter transmembrane protein EcfT [Microbacterium protaetiae]QAY59416.1 energy-coupling factor transporter transmembrane protein EcfT [Microbacterium protaetiae]